MQVPRYDRCAVCSSCLCAERVAESVDDVIVILCFWGDSTARRALWIGRSTDTPLYAAIMLKTNQRRGLVRPESVRRCVLCL